jgi:hypothetical protein
VEYRKLSRHEEGSRRIGPRRYGTDLIKEKGQPWRRDHSKVQGRFPAEEQVQKVREGVKTNPGNDFAKRLTTRWRQPEPEPGGPPGLIETVRG